MTLRVVSDVKTDGHVTATIVNENTLSVNGTLFVRKRDDEVLLQPMQDTVAPKLRCSNCHYERAYYYWYKALHYQERVVDFCPGCGHPILGVVGHAD